ncbi:hypothetical protein [Deefgea sp. CFH1-16]|uniref:hypothetical protein n=1 Tax=Deefgea sp. CFH1-16 TaxID=2675457 RepID=UPI001940329A|nr:hypothetical protein [Deefgea sp. CFH1-16]
MMKLFVFVFALDALGPVFHLPTGGRGTASTPNQSQNITVRLATLFAQPLLG